jgi:hypothetical protein
MNPKKSKVVQPFQLEFNQFQPEENFIKMKNKLNIKIVNNTSKSDHVEVDNKRLNSINIEISTLNKYIDGKYQTIWQHVVAEVAVDSSSLVVSCVHIYLLPFSDVLISI